MKHLTRLIVINIVLFCATVRADITATPYVTSSGAELMIVTTLADGSACANVTGFSGTITVQVNGAAVTMGPATWTNTSKQCPWVAFAFPAPVLATDSVTYTLSPGAITTISGAWPPPAAGIPVANYVGQDEPGFGGHTGFAPKPKMKLGVDLGNARFNSLYGYCQSRNAIRMMSIGPFPGTTIIWNATDPSLPDSWTPGGKIGFSGWNTTGANGLNAQGLPMPQGQYSIVYDDANANNDNALQVCLVANLKTCLGCDQSKPGDGPGSTYTRTVAGNTVTVTYQLKYPVDPNPLGYNFGLSMIALSPTGDFARNGTITNFWVFFPGDEANDRSDPIAASATLKRFLTAPNGAGPAVIRVQGQVSNQTSIANIQEPADLVQDSSFSWGNVAKPVIQIIGARKYNTDPSKDNVVGDGTYPWPASTHFYHPLLGSKSDALGKFIDLATSVGVAGPGTQDGGEILNVAATNNFATCTYAAIEFRTAAPHGLRSGDQLSFTNAVATMPNIPITGGALTAQSTATASLTQGNANITFSAPQTFTAGQVMTFSGDPSGQAYVCRGGSGNLWGFTPTYAGPTVTASAFSTTASAYLFQLNPIVWVTSPSTFASLIFSTNGVTSGAGIKQVATNTEIPISIQAVPWNNNGAGPISFYAKLAGETGSDLWLSLPPHGSDALLRAIADQVAKPLRCGATLYCEIGVEPWNWPQFPTGVYSQVYGRASQYLPPLTGVDSAANPYYMTGTAPAVLSLYPSYMLLSAHQCDVIQAQFDTYNKGLKVFRFVGGQWSGAQAAGIISFAHTLGTPATGGLQRQIPISGLGVGPYVGALTDSSYATFCATASPPAIHDVYKHYLKYSTTLKSWAATPLATLQAYAGPPAAGQINGKPALLGYECGITSIANTASIPLQHDLFYSPSFARTFNAYAGMLQDNGFSAGNIENLGGNWGQNGTTLWSCAIWAGQPIGPGTGNLYSTLQGGQPGDGGCYDRQNAAVELFAAQNWWAQTATAP